MEICDWDVIFDKFIFGIYLCLLICLFIYVLNGIMMSYVIFYMLKFV